VECTLSQLLSRANKVVSALGLGTKVFIAGLIQRRWTTWSKPITWFDNYYIELNSNNDKFNTVSRIIVLIIRQKIINC
jgi:hypothetical protein